MEAGRRALPTSGGGGSLKFLNNFPCNYFGILSLNHLFLCIFLCKIKLINLAIYNNNNYKLFLLNCNLK